MRMSPRRRLISAGIVTAVTLLSVPVWAAVLRSLEAPETFKVVLLLLGLGLLFVWGLATKPQVAGRLFAQVFRPLPLLLLLVVPVLVGAWTAIRSW